ncbi:MAG: pyridoxal phosphate-dependent aminotransferase family protein [Planctomycetota bacterium]
MPVIESPPGAETVIDGRRYLYFAGTGYLGLQGHPEVIRAACEATERYGIASATTRAGFGDTPPTLDVERQAARFFGAEAAFYFMSGYVGSDILARFTENTVDAVFVDECSHYSVVDAAHRLGKPVHVFDHADAEALAGELRRKLPPGGRPLVISDGVFSARGTIAPVAEYRDILGRYPGSILMLDDAHALGVLGENGRGTFEHAGLWPLGVNVGVPDRGKPDSPPCLLLSGTLSKALGGFGGIIPGTRAVIGRIKSTSPYFAGASAPPVPAAAASARALELVITQPEMRTRLWANVRTLKSGLGQMGLDVDDTPVPIISLTLGTADAMRRIQRELAQRGIMIAYLPTYSGLGPEGALRLAVFSTHTGGMITRLLDELRQLV